MTRRTALQALGAAPALAQAPAPRPNLLYVVIDQLSGLAIPGEDPLAQMPNLAKLAAGGVRFSHAYTAGMTCGPSRASLDSGLHTHRHRVGGGGPRQLDASVNTLPRTLEAQGYVTSHPAGYNLEAERSEHEKWLAALGYSGASSIYGEESQAQYRSLPLKWKCGAAGLAAEHGFETYCAQRAIRFLETSRNRPFACFLQLRGPHDPYMTPRPYDRLLDPARIPLPPYREGEFSAKPPRQQASFETQGASRMTDSQLREVMGLYYGMCSYSDSALGQVMAKLKALDLERSTAIVLVSDHGDTLGRHRMMSKDFAFYEHAMRTPMIFVAPGESSAALPRGVVRKDPVSGVDVYPTLCELMGLPAPGAIDGESLISRWRGNVSRPNREILSGQGVPGKNRARMLRTPTFKYARYDDGGEELYDLERDPEELENRVADAKYAKMLGEFQNRTASL